MKIQNVSLISEIIISYKYDQVHLFDLDELIVKMTSL